MTPPRPTQREGPIDQRQHRVRQARGATRGRFEKFLATTLQVPHALLVKRTREGQRDSCKYANKGAAPTSENTNARTGNEPKRDALSKGENRRPPGQAHRLRL
jgi:hypothetical protein